MIKKDKADLFGRKWDHPTFYIILNWKQNKIINNPLQMIANIQEITEMYFTSCSW